MAIENMRDFDENSQDNILLEDMQKISRNQDYINQRKLEVKLRNVDPEKDRDGNRSPRNKPQNPFQYDNMVALFDEASIIVKKAGIYGDGTRFDFQIDFNSSAAGGIFDSNFMPTAYISPMYGDVARYQTLLRDIRPGGLNGTLVSLKGQFRGGEIVSAQVFAIGVKGPYLED